MASMVRCCVRCRKSCFLAWINGLRDACPWALVPRDDPDIIAIDGKTSRRSHDRRKGRNPLHLVSAWAARQRIVLGQQATEEKSNEITAIPLLLKHLDLKGALVTMDAMGTQTDIARAIRDGGGDYCLSLKKNWPAVYADVEQLFSDPPDDVAFETHATVDLTGGRIETRRHTVCHKVDWMTSDRHYPGEPVFPDLAMIGRIETEVERNGRIECETRYYLCSLALCSDMRVPCGRIDTAEFDRQFDVAVAMSVFESLTEARLQAFLRRARRWPGSRCLRSRHSRTRHHAAIFRKSRCAVTVGGWTA